MTSEVPAARPSTVRNRMSEQPDGRGADGGGPDGDVGVAARGVVKEYHRGEVVVRALDGVDLDVATGSFVAVVGPSGSGKSTLLHLLSGLDRPTRGEVVVAGRRIDRLTDDELSDLRRDEIGFVFQFFNLLPALSAWENVALPATFGGRRLGALRARAVELLDRVGMGDRVEHRPAELSGGQMQRVAIARALVASPSLIVADEPTGNLDSTSGEQVLDVLSSLVDAGTTLVMVTHSDQAAARAHRVVHLRDGRVADDRPNGTRPAAAADDPAGTEGVPGPADAGATRPAGATAAGVAPGTGDGGGHDRGAPSRPAGGDR
jgi:putative ABC transport system ATP-binding protein